MTWIGAVLAGAVWVVAAVTAAAQEIPYEPVTPPTPGASVCPGGLCQAEGLNSLFEALAASEAEERAEPVRIVQIGDSHTLGDRITGKVRADLQGRFGHGGRGALPAGPPYGGYAPFQANMEARGWAVEAAPLHYLASGPVPDFGLAALRGRAVPGAELTIRLEPGAEARRVGVCGWPRGRGDGLSIDPDNDLPWLADLNGSDDDGPACFRFDMPRRATELTLSGVGPGVILDTVWTESGEGGVVLSSLGQSGGMLADLASRDDRMVGMTLGALEPSLIVLAYGTNEGFDDGLDPVAYEQLLRAQIARLRRMPPFGVAILILGAPDALRGGQTDGCSADGQRAPPPSLGLVRDVQRRVAADLGVAFWDWHGRMGGDCSADRLALRTDPYVRGDRVHFTGAGADWIGGVLAADLMAAYDAWKAERTGRSAD
ncbi:hypothetical protein N0B44_29880 [Roseibacterium beibuensis]|uniref:hypothetical protein n=1 Tax=[Roseibacterium] beibuensis TaxID=1193142 RepID=UPI00217DE850|nr:hypothetical protein [Roseibacterium beibuensis]MCS6627131.1 hypothetical protein [Roseibacterium beibuensis]